MKYTNFVQPAYSLALPVAVGTDNGAEVDKLGYDQVQPFFGCDALPLDGIVDWKVQGASSSGGTFADITGAAGVQLKVDDDTIVAAVDLVNDTALTIAAQPATPCRFRVEVVDTTPSITAGQVDIVGKDIHGNAQSETILYTAGAIKTSVKIYSEVTSITPSAFTVLGGASDETIEVGFDNSTGIHFGAMDGTQLPRFLRMVAVVTAGASGNIFAGFNLISAKRLPDNMFQFQTEPHFVYLGG